MGSEHVPPVIETERLALRPLSEGDLDALYRISNDPLVRRYLWDDEPVSRAKIGEVITESMRSFVEEGLGIFGLRPCGEDTLVGFCGFLRLPGMEEVELGYELTPELWGRGLAAEAARACLRFAFETRGLERVVAGADAPNTASLRVLEKLGMKPVGNVNPAYPEAPYFALYREEFLAGRRRPYTP